MRTHPKTFITNPATGAWLLLMLLTLLSWGLSVDANLSAQLTNSTVLLVAFFKIRLVIMHFMEINTAPTALRYFFELWVLATVGLLIAMAW